MQGAPPPPPLTLSPSPLSPPPLLPPPSPSPPPPSPSPPPPSPKPPCAYQVDFSLVIDESGSIKEVGPDEVKAFAKELVHMFSLGEKATRFSVVSFAANATTRVPWSYSEAEINAGIDEISPDGPTSISDGFELARELFLEGGRTGAARIVLFLSDGEQTVDAKVNTTLYQTALDAANSVKALPATVFAWGFGPDASRTTLEQIASEPSHANPFTTVTETDVAALRGYLAGLEGAVCNESPPTSPPLRSPSPSSSPPPPPGRDRAAAAESSPPVLTLNVIYYDFRVHEDGHFNPVSHPDFERSCRPGPHSFDPCVGEKGLVEATLGVDGRRRAWQRACGTVYMTSWTA